MSVLKFRGDHGFGWITDVQRVETGVAFEVGHDDFGCPSRVLDRSCFGNGWNQIDHGIPDAGSYDGSITEKRESWTAVELMVVTHDPSAQDGQRHCVHVVSAGECWLMGDDGRTIDRIP